MDVFLLAGWILVHSDPAAGVYGQDPKTPLLRGECLVWESQGLIACMSLSVLRHEL